MSKKNAAIREEAIANLKKYFLADRKRLYVKLIRHTQTTRHFMVLTTICRGEATAVADITYLVAKACGFRLTPGKDYIVLGGGGYSGMDHILQALEQATGLVLSI